MEKKGSFRKIIRNIVIVIAMIICVLLIPTKNIVEEPKDVEIKEAIVEKVPEPIITELSLVMVR